MKFSDIPYKRPEFDDAAKQFYELARDFEQAESSAAAREAYMAYDELQKHINTMQSLVYIRHTLDTGDEFYDAEQAYFDEITPLLGEYQQRFERALLASAHREALEREFGKLMFRNIEISIKTFDPVIMPELQLENKLATEYDKLLASARIPFDGKILTLAQIAPYLQSPDKTVRQEACDARSEWFLNRAEELDSIFDKLVKTRDAMAKKLGYDNFIRLGYYRMRRNCYGAAEVRRFREGVLAHIVPLAARLKREQAERIGTERLTMYDDAFVFPTGNPKPFGTPEQIFEHGRRMYGEMSPETGEFIGVMLENELFDVLTRPGKSGGGYCIDLPDYSSSFIFANFNGTAQDIDVLTHEAGHAFAAYCLRDASPSPLREYTNETAEVHSMSMELFAWPWMEGFFGADSEKYRYSHLSGNLTFIPYGVMVDDFQHRIYENPEMTPRGRNELWKSLESVYRPWLSLENTPFFEEGRRWQYQAHIYQTPFYYIDYCLAQTVALAFWSEAEQNRTLAWERYIKLISLSGKRTFTEILNECGLPDPFDADTLQKLSCAASEKLETFPSFL